MTLVVLGIDALDPELVDPEVHSNLTLNNYKPIDTISSYSGHPSTHELWPSIITGLPPEKHGIQLTDGVAWESPLLRLGSRLTSRLFPERLATALGALILNRTTQQTFRIPNNYYSNHNLTTVFDDRVAKPIGIPNYVVGDETDREDELRKRMGDLFKRDPDSKSGHSSSNPSLFYDRCIEMALVRFARIRASVRSRRYELVFGYTSALDLIGHVAYNHKGMQKMAYNEIDQFVEEIRSDLEKGDELLLVSDHGLQDGLHTMQAIVSGTSEGMLEDLSGVLDIKNAIEEELERANHLPDTPGFEPSGDQEPARVKEHLSDLGYL